VEGGFLDGIVCCSVPEGISYVVDCVRSVTGPVNAALVRERMASPAAMVGICSFIEEEVTYFEAEESSSELTGQIERRWRLETYR
jgi:hypothetical protein